MIHFFEKYPVMKVILVGIAILISIILLDGVWHPFPLEYHFGWWFLWFQLGLFAIYAKKYEFVVPIWIYLIWVTLRGLPWAQNWKKTWKPFWTALIGENRIEHWEKWSYRSIYSIEMLVVQNQVEPIEEEVHTQVEVAKEHIYQNVAEPIEIQTNLETPKEEDQVSSISDLSFDTDLSELDSLEQQLKEKKESS